MTVVQAAVRGENFGVDVRCRAWAIHNGTEPSELLFLDPAISDPDTILENLRPEVDAIVLDACRPAARQMAEALHDRGGLDAVHVIAHGVPGQLNLAAGAWAAETLPGIEADLADIGQALGATGDLRLWSCDVGTGNAGRDFINTLSRAARAPVAAASDLVGSKALGGEWKLSIRTGNAAARPPLTREGMMSYAAVFAAIEIKVSGRIKKGPTTHNITYFVLDKSNNAIVGSFMLPDASSQVNLFKIPVKVPTLSSFDVGTYDETGRFVSAGFTIETPSMPTGAIGPSR